MITLRIHDTEYQIPEGITTIGRSDDADIMVDSSKLSRQHCRFTYDGNTLYLEDLDSKNGVFVDGDQITGKAAVNSNSQVSLADLPCSFVFPNASPQAAAPAKRGPVKKAAKAAVKSQAGKRKEKELIVKVIVGAVVALIVMIGYGYIANMEPEGLPEAKLLVASIEDDCDNIEVEDMIESNFHSLVTLNEFKVKLQTISPELEEPYKQAQKLITDINELQTELETRNVELKRLADAESQLTQIMTAYENKTVSPAQTISSLQNLRNQYQGTKPAQDAEININAIESILKTAEQASVTSTIQEAQLLITSGDYGNALSKVNQSLQKQYTYLKQDDLRELTSLAEDIPRQAEEYFQAAVRKAITKAKTGDTRAMQDKLRQEAARIGTDNLQPVLANALQKIDAIRAERLVQARKKLEQSLKKADKLASERMYQQAMDLYMSLLPKIEEQELKNELLSKKQPLTYLIFAKAAVIKYINAEQGLNVEGMGIISSVNDETITLEIEGTAMPLNWAKLQDREFMSLFVKALDSKPDANGYAIYASILADNGKTREADRYIAKALQLMPGIKKEYPELCAAYKKRAKENEAEAARLAEERKIAWEKAQLPRNHENRILRPIPMIKEPIMGNTPEADAIVANLQVFPKDSHWNTPIDHLPVLPNSDALAANLTNDDFRSRMRTECRPSPEFPYIIVPPNYPAAELTFDPYPASCDPGDYPIPDNMPIQGWADQFTGTGDRHAYVLDPYAMVVYEFYHAYRLQKGGWKAFACKYDLTTNRLRREGLTSADAAGLPMWPAFIRYDECERGMVEHAMRVNIPLTRNEYIYPAIHSTTTGTSPDLPAMGQRFRLKADFKIEGFSKHEKAVLKGLKKYGMFVADNGDSCAICAVGDKRLQLKGLYNLKVTDFEAVDTSLLPKPKN